MQVKKLVLALAAAIAAPAAFAVDITTAPVAVPVENRIFITGATAQSPGLAISLGKLCASTAGSVFQAFNDGLAVPAAKAWKCEAPANATYTKLPGVTGPWIVFKNEGGSLNGINPIRSNATASTGQILTTGCTVAAFPAVGACPGALVLQPALIGLSDVSQKVFAAKNQLAAPTAGYTYTPDIAIGAGQGFGVVVSPTLYALLQADQGVGTGVPSISKQQYATLMTQTSGFWSTLLPNTAHPVAGQTLTLSRRSLTSGTQASAELFFLSNPCSTGAAPIGGGLAAVAGTAAGQSFSDGLDTMIVKQAGSSDAVLADASSATGLAIGVVSLENPQPASSWKFVAIDGVHPGTVGAPEWQKKNIVNGKYAYAYESFMFKTTRSNVNANPVINAAILNNTTDFVNGIVADLGVGANLATSNGLFGDPLAASADFGPETNHYSRGGNECAPSVWQF